MIHKRILATVAVIGFLFGTGSVVLGILDQQQLAQAQKQSKKLALAAQKTGQVLAAEDSLPDASNDVHFEVNIPAVFNDTVTINGELIAGTFTVGELTAELLTVDELAADNLTVTGELTAPNVLYSLVGTDGLNITGDQELIITNTDKGSSQNIFKTFIVGSDEAEAGSNSDEFTFVAGNNISLALNTTDKKLTIANTYSAPASPWVDGGSSVYLSTVSDLVGIGTASPAYNLHVVGDGYVDGDFTVTGAANFNGATFDGDTTLGNAITDNITFTGRLASGTAILPIVDLGADLGSSSLRFNNIYVATINTNSTLSTAGQAIFTYEPTSTTYTQSSVLINPTAPPANSFLLALGQGGLQRAGIDAEGDLTLGYSSGVSAPSTSNPLDIYGHNATQVAYIDTSGNAVFDGSVTATSFIGSTTGSLNPGFTLGSVAFQGASGLTQDNANFFWDDTNNRLGLGTTSPSSILDVKAANDTEGTPGIILRNANATTISPAIEFGNANVRMFRSANHNLTMSIFNDLLIDTVGGTGRVGIGTTSPLARFDIRGNSGITPVASFSAQTSFAAMVVDNKGLGDLFTASSSGLSRFVVKQSGNVGIGTGTPDGHLTIENSVDPAIVLRSTSANTSNAEPRIKFYEQSNMWWDIFLDGGSNNQLLFTTDGTYANTAFTLLNANAVGAGDIHPDAHFEISANGTTGGNVFLVSSNDDNDGDLLTLNELGNLGMGTTSPLARLDIRGGSGTTPVASFSGQTSFAAMVVDNRGLGDIFTASSSGLNRFVVTQNGNVGVGISNPSYQFEVSTTLAGLQTSNFNNLSTSASAYNKINLQTGSGALELFDYSQNASPGLLGLTQGASLIRGSGTELGITTQGAYSLQFGTTNTERMRITSGGNVGIGTTAPTSKLHVDGSFYTFGSATVSASYTGGKTLVIQAIPSQSTNITEWHNSSGTTVTRINTSGQLYAPYGEFVTTSGSLPGLVVRGYSGQQIVDIFRVQNGSSVNKLIVDENGSVGVGIDTPTAQLHVAGAYGSNAAVIVDQLNSGNIISASASGTTRFQVSNAGYVNIAGTTSTDLLLKKGTASNGSTNALMVRKGDDSADASIQLENLVATNGFGRFLTNRWTIFGGGAPASFALASDYQLKWDSSTNAAAATPDTGLARNSAGVVRVSNGSTGYGNLLAGNIGINEASPDTRLHITDTAIADNAALLTLEDVNSTCTFSADTGGGPSCGSDLTLKKDVASLDTVSLLDRVANLRPVSYHWKTEDVNAPLQHGFIAQEVAEQFPELVKDGTWIDGSTRKFLNMGGLMPYVVGAVKEQQLQINQLALNTNTELSTENLTPADLQALADTQTAQQTQLDAQKSLIEQLQQQLASIFNNAVTFLADVTFKGRLMLSPDQTGRLVVPVGAAQAKVTFQKPLPVAPIISLTPHRQTPGLVLGETTTEFFTVTFDQPLTAELKIDWLASLKDPGSTAEPTVEFVLESTPEPITATPAPEATVEPTPTPSPTPAEPVASESAGQ